MNKILIITGGYIDADWCQGWISDRQYDYVIAADSGLNYVKKSGIHIDLLLGDYDSVDPDVFDEYKRNVTTKIYPREKDFTDTHLALKKAIEMGAKSIDIIGATGSRLDHVMTNISVLYEALSAGIICNIYDKNNKIYLVGDECRIEKKCQYGSYVSIIAYTDSAQITLTGMKYNLSDYVLKKGVSIGQSNEIQEKECTISVKNGVIIVTESVD